MHLSLSLCRPSAARPYIERRQGSKTQRMLNHVKLREAQIRFRSSPMLLYAERLASFALPYDILALGCSSILPWLACGFESSE